MANRKRAIGAMVVFGGILWIIPSTITTYINANAAGTVPCEQPPASPVASAMSSCDNNSALTLDDIIDIECNLTRIMPRMSDGSYFYFKTINDHYQLFHHDALRSDVQVSSFENGVQFFWASPAEDLLLIKTGYSNHGQCGIYVYNRSADTLHSVNIPCDEDSGPMLWMPDGSGVLYRAQEGSGEESKYCTSLYSLSGGRAQLVYRPQARYSRPRCVSSNGERVIVEENKQTHIVEVNVVTGEKREFPTHSSVGVYYPLSYTCSSTQVICEHRVGPEEDGFVAINVSTGSVHEIVSRVGLLDRREGVRAVVCPEMDLIASILSTGGYSELGVWRISDGSRIANSGMIAGHYNSPLFRGGYLHFMMSNACVRSASYRWDPLSPVGSVEPNNWSGADASAARGGGVGADMVSPCAKPTLICYSSHDGLQVPAWLYLPNCQRGAGRWPLIIAVHGGPRDRCDGSFSAEFVYFLEHGFAILAPNIRGSDGYGARYAALDNYKRRHDAVRDVVAGAEWCIANGYANPGSIGIMGHSYGGTLAMLAMSAAPGVFAAGYAGAPISDFVSLLSGVDEAERYSQELEYGPLSDVEFLQSISPIYRIDEFVAPLLIAHGKDDRVVPYEQSVRLVGALEGKGARVEFISLEGEGHAFRKRESVREVVRQKAEFFASWIGR